MIYLDFCNITDYDVSCKTQAMRQQGRHSWLLEIQETFYCVKKAKKSLDTDQNIMCNILRVFIQSYCWQNE